MIDDIRRDILQSLARLGELAPDVRFGQLIANLSYLAIGPTNEAIWDMEDEQLLEAILKQTETLSGRQPIGVEADFETLHRISKG